jgi:SAM-dependent methyltransferase
MDEYSIRRFYDAIADETAERWYGNDTLLITLRDFSDLLPPHPAILDLGCGTGHEAKRLHSLGARVTGIDISPRSIAIARERTPECVFHEMDLFDIDITPGTFDGIVAAGSLIHLPLPRLRIALTRAAAMLRDGGLFLAVMQVGDRDFIHYPDIGRERVRRIVYRLSREMILDCFKRAGLRFVRVAPMAEELIDGGWKAYIFQK